MADASSALVTNASADPRAQHGQMLPEYSYPGYPSAQRNPPPQQAPPVQQGTLVSHGGYTWQGPFYDVYSGRYYYYDPCWPQQTQWAAQTPPQVLQPPGPYPPAYGYVPPLAPQAYVGYPAAPAGYGIAAGYGAAYSSYGTSSLPSESKDECGDFKRGRCHRGVTCRYAHVAPTQECQEFKRGVCRHGTTCKFLHNGVMAGESQKSRSRSR